MRGSLRITTWNVNSVRIRLDVLRRIAETAGSDIICLQETKVIDDDFPHEAIAAMGFAHRLVHGMKSYNGVAILSRVPIENSGAWHWCGHEDCRHLVAELPGGTELHNVYVPAGGDIPDPVENDKFAHKLQFLSELGKQFAAMDQAKRILVGDLNIAPLETDVWSHKQLLDVVSHTPVEVEHLNRLMASHQWIDAVRHFIPPEERLYTWWSYRNRTWPGSDRGRRLDHFWVTPSLKKSLKGAEVLNEARTWEKPSDHVPVTVTLAI